MKVIGRLLVLLGLVGSVSAMAVDKYSSFGNVRVVEVNTQSGLGYLTYHGKLIFEDYKGYKTFYWGGLACGTKTLSENQVDLLSRRVTGSRESVRIIYRYGQNNSKCVVGFTFVNSQSVSDIYKY